jgi:hypothetical protein
MTVRSTHRVPEAALNSALPIFAPILTISAISARSIVL